MESLVFRINTDYDSYLKVGIVNVDIVRKGEDGELFYPPEPFMGLSIRAQVSIEWEEKEFYGYRLYYRDVRQVDVEKAESMLKTLRSIEKKLATLGKRFGDAKTLTAYLYRVADILGISEVHFPTEHKEYHNLTFLDWGLTGFIRKWTE